MLDKNGISSAINLLYIHGHLICTFNEIGTWVIEGI